MKNNLLKEAIADAKNLKQAAIANAKLALEEAFTPHIKEMFASRVSEMANEDLNEEELDENEDTNEGYNEDGDINENPTMDEGDLNLDEILAELEAAELSETDEMDEVLDIDALLAEGEDLEEGEEETDTKPKPKKKETDSKPKAEKPKAPAKPKEPKTDNNGDGMSTEEDETVEEMTIDELKDLIRAIINGDEEGDGDGDADDMGGLKKVGGTDFSMNEDEDIDLMEMFEDDVNEASEEPQLQSAIKGAQVLAQALDKGIDFVKGKGKQVVANAMKDLMQALENTGTIVGKSMRNEEEGSLEELRSELNEVNLLNAKLLYSNKIFRNNNLNENQKLKVINTFDKAKNVGETKLIYETIKDSFVVNKDRKPIKESLGFASKPAGGSSKNDIIPQPDEFITRMQKLAGIITKK